jgi:hypothetical protein
MPSTNTRTLRQRSKGHRLPDVYGYQLLPTPSPPPVIYVPYVLLVSYRQPKINEVTDLLGWHLVVGIFICSIYCGVKTSKLDSYDTCYTLSIVLCGGDGLPQNPHSEWRVSNAHHCNIFFTFSERCLALLSDKKMNYEIDWLVYPCFSATGWRCGGELQQSAQGKAAVDQIPHALGALLLWREQQKTEDRGQVYAGDQENCTGRKCFSVSERQ